MNVYQKLNACRVQLQKSKLTKSGNNKFAGYQYFELGDFLPTINTLFSEQGLFSKVSFSADVAELQVINVDKPDEVITFTSPMGSASLKGCHEVQNVGAVETYQRRYLYVTALEIVEHDALDASEPAQPKRFDLNASLAWITKANTPEQAKQRGRNAYAQAETDEQRAAIQDAATNWKDAA